MNGLAHLVIIGSIGYTVAVERQGAISADSTRLYIQMLESSGEDRDEIEAYYLETAKEIYERYENKK